MSPQPISEVIRQIHFGYLEASMTLASFMERMQISISDQHKLHLDAIAKFTHPTPLGDEDVVELKKQGFSVFKISHRMQELTIDALAHSAAKIITAFPQLLMKMGFIYLVAIFDAFLSDIFTSVFIHRPESLKSKKQLTYEQILDLQQSGNLISFLAHREINELSYKSITDQANYYNSKFGIDLSSSGVAIGILAEIRARRNLLVHNNGVVNETYLRVIDQTPYSVGETIEITFEYWKESQKHLDTVASFVWGSILDKFGESYETPLAT